MFIAIKVTKLVVYLNRRANKGSETLSVLTQIEKSGIFVVMVECTYVCFIQENVIVYPFELGCP